MVERQPGERDPTRRSIRSCKKELHLHCNRGLQKKKDVKIHKGMQASLYASRPKERHLHSLSELVCKEHNIHQGFSNVRVQVTEVVRELVDVLGQELIRVLDAVVDIGDLVESNAIQVLIVCELFFF